MDSKHGKHKENLQAALHKRTEMAIFRAVNALYEHGLGSVIESKPRNEQLEEYEAFYPVDDDLETIGKAMHQAFLEICASLGDKTGESLKVTEEGEAFLYSAPIFVTGNMKQTGGGASKLPVPMPSWMIWLEDIQLLERIAPPRLKDDGRRIRQEFALKITADARSRVQEAEDRFTQNVAIHFSIEAEVFTPDEKEHLFLAVNPKTLKADFNGMVLARGAVTKGMIKLEHPAGSLVGYKPDDEYARIFTLGESVLTGKDLGVAGSRRSQGGLASDAGAMAAPSRYFPPGRGGDWPAGWMKWIVLSYKTREGSISATALIDLGQWFGETKMSSTSGRVAPIDTNDKLKGKMAIDIGASNTFCVMDLESGWNLFKKPTRIFDMHINGDFVAELQSGWKLLCGDPDAAGYFGCGEWLKQRNNCLPSAVHFSSVKALNSYLETTLKEKDSDKYRTFVRDAWLKQEYQSDILAKYKTNPNSQTDGEPVEITKFKAPDLISKSGVNLENMNRYQLAKSVLGTFVLLLGQTIAINHADPDSDNAFFLDELDVAICYSEIDWKNKSDDDSTAEDRIPYSRVLRSACGTEKKQGINGDGLFRKAMCGFWDNIEIKYVCELDAVRYGKEKLSAKSKESVRQSDKPSDKKSEKQPKNYVKLFLDFGGQTVDVVVVITSDEEAMLRPMPVGTREKTVKTEDVRSFCLKTSYKIGGEFLLHALAYALSHFDSENEVKRWKMDSKTSENSIDRLTPLDEWKHRLEHIVNENQRFIATPLAEDVLTIVKKYILKLAKQQVSAAKLNGDKSNRFKNYSVEAYVYGGGWLLSRLDETPGERIANCGKFVKELMQEEFEEKCFADYLTKRELCCGALKWCKKRGIDKTDKIDLGEVIHRSFIGFDACLDTDDPNSQFLYWYWPPPALLNPEDSGLNEAQIENGYLHPSPVSDNEFWNDFTSGVGNIAFPGPGVWKGKDTVGKQVNNLPLRKAVLQDQGTERSYRCIESPLKEWVNDSLPYLMAWSFGQAIKKQI